MDKFRQFLKQREDEMNVDTPSEEVWQHIPENTAPKKNKIIPFVKRYAVAASVIVLIGAGIIIVKTTGKNSLSDDNVVKTNESVKKDTAIEMKKTIDSISVPEMVKLMPSADQKKSSQRFSIRTNNIIPGKVKSADKGITMIDNGYAQLINFQIKKVCSTPVYAEQPGYFDQFALQLKQMDAGEANVKKDIQAYGLNDQLLEQLINVYQQKLNLLKNLQQEINKMNNRVKENEAPSDNLKPYFINL
jgi:hypothetical protein